MLPYAGLAEAAAGRGEVVAEIVVVHEAARSEPAAAATLHGGACPPDLSVITKVNGHILFSSNHRTSSAATYYSIAHTSCSVLFMQKGWKGCATTTCSTPKSCRRGWRCRCITQSGCSSFSRTVHEDIEEFPGSLNAATF